MIKILPILPITLCNVWRKCNRNTDGICMALVFHYHHRRPSLRSEHRAEFSQHLAIGDLSVFCGLRSASTASVLPSLRMIHCNTLSFERCAQSGRRNSLPASGQRAKGCCTSQEQGNVAEKMPPQQRGKCTNAFHANLSCTSLRERKRRIQDKKGSAVT